MWNFNTYIAICYCLRANEAELARAREDIGLLLPSFPPDISTKALCTAIAASCVEINMQIASYICTAIVIGLS